MSWKGFTKAVSRLPTQLAQRTGHSASSDSDPEWAQLEDRFKHLDGLVRRLSDDSVKFKDALSAMLAHQARFGSTLLEVYRPITGLPRHGSSNSLEDPSTASEISLDPTMIKSPSAMEALNKMALNSKHVEGEHKESIARVEAFSLAMARARELLLPDLDVIERQVVRPCGEWIVLCNNVKRYMEKRARKHVDHDRHNDAVRKLAAKEGRTLGDEKKLGSLETNFDQATREFNQIDITLKRELPLFFAAATQFVDPCFRSLYLYQLKVLETLHQSFASLCEVHFKNMGNPLAEFEAEHDQMMEALAALALNKRPYRTASGELLPDGELSMEDLNDPSSSSNDLKLRQQNEFDANAGRHVPPPPTTGSSTTISGPPQPPSRPEQLPAYEEPMTASGSGPAHAVGVTPTPVLAGAGKAHYKPGNVGNDDGHAAPYQPVTAGLGLHTYESHPAASSSTPSSSTIVPTITKTAPPPEGVTHVVAMYDFESNEPGDLTFKRDDRIVVTARTSDVNGWWFGRIGDRTGQFPGNYVVDL